jgi:pilus assembly protein Flp/PilA
VDLELLLSRLLDAMQTSSFVAPYNRGPTSVEYAVMLALILLVCLSAITAVGTQAAGQFNNIATIVGTGGS